MSETVKKPWIFLLLVFSSVAHAAFDGPKYVMKISYQIGPEVLFLLFPPFKLSFEAHTDYPTGFYVGTDFSINVLFAIWGHVGLYSGVQYENVFIEEKVSWTGYRNSDVPQSFHWSSHSPKLGIQHNSMFFKAGPNFFIGAAPEKKPSLLARLVVGTNWEFGFHTDPVANTWFNREMRED